MTRRNRTRLRVLNGGKAKGRAPKETPMTTTMVDVKSWPQETQELAARLRQDHPQEALRWAVCQGEECAVPHAPEVYVGFLEWALCGTCEAEIPTQLLEGKGSDAGQ